LLPSHNNSISEKQQTNQTKNTAKQHAAARPTANHKMPKHPGFFSNIGYSFGVVGLVFIIVGIVLLLIGGLIIDTLAALAIAFGFVFILIWLVLAILQGLFDVIL
jgi:Flp pilus assembly protein TadB